MFNDDKLKDYEKEMLVNVKEKSEESEKEM